MEYFFRLNQYVVHASDLSLSLVWTVKRSSRVLLAVLSYFQISIYILFKDFYLYHVHIDIMNLAFLASIAWFVWNPKKEPEPIILAQEKLKDRGIYIIQNEMDSNVLMTSGGDEIGQKFGNVTAEKWQKITETSWLIKITELEKAKGLYRITPADNTYNNMSSVALNKVPPFRFAKRYWSITYAGHSFGDDKWLLRDFGSNGIFQGKCLENEGLKKSVDFKPCNKTLTAQRWKFCLCTEPLELEAENSTKSP